MLTCCVLFFFFFSSRRRHTRSLCDWSSDVCSSDLGRCAYTFAEGAHLPLVLEPTVEGLELAKWNAENREWIEAQLLVHGGVLFRNFNLPSPADFERARSEERRVGKECRSRWSPYH